MIPIRHDQTLDLVSNDSICEAVGCFEKATSQIVVKVGEQREIPLNLCKDCIEKFEEKNE
jgi:hypothetical protein